MDTRRGIGVAVRMAERLASCDVSTPHRPASLPASPPAAVRDKRVRFELAKFTNYDKGRSLPWVAGWMFVQLAVFRCWWFPRRFRPAVLRFFGAEVGERVMVRDGGYILWPWHLTIGDDVWIGREVHLLTSTHITIGHDVCISQRAMIMTSGHDPYSEDFHVYDYPIKIGNHVWVAAASVVLHGARIPDHTVVEAGGTVKFGQRIPWRDDL